MKNILVCGGAGFIGTNLIKRLLKDNNKDKNKIICVDNLFTGNLENIQYFIDRYPNNFLFLQCDITNYSDYEDIYNAIEDFFYNNLDEVYNLACPASPPKYMIDPIYTINCSIAVEQLCELTLEFNAKILHTSTSEVYGDPDDSNHPQNEEYRGNVNMIGPRSCYDEGKRLAETIMYEYHNIGCKGKIIRIFNTYGPYMDPEDGRVVSNFICQALENKDITIYGDGTQTRSFQYVDDLIDAMIKIMATEDSFIGPLNVGTSFEFTMDELAIIILELIPESYSKIIYKPLPKDDPKQRNADITKIYNKIGWKPKVTLREGLLKTIKYFKTKLKKNEI